MPRKQGYARKKKPARQPRRLLQLRKLDKQVHPSARGITKMLYDAAFDPQHPVANAVRKMVNTRASQPKPKSQYRGRSGMHRHEKLKQAGTNGPVNKGKGFNSSANGKIVTHGKGTVPRWKLKRKGLYKYDVYQTVLLSKSNRLAGSNNTLETYRYPIKAPECLDSERVQSMIFQPFCSHYSGIHSTMFRKIRSDGTDIDHDTQQRLDVIQNKADIARQELPAAVDAAGGGLVAYEHSYQGGVITAGTARSLTNIMEIHRYYDQLVKKIKCDLVFTASRAYPVQISVSVIRMIDATSPYELTTDDKRMLLNNLDNKGLEWAKYKVEWSHQFTLKGLKKDKDPPQYSINKTLDTNFLVTNTFEKNNVSEAMAQSGTTLLGKGIDVRTNEVSDGDVSGAFLILIKYRKVQKPNVFTYRQTLDTTASGVPTAHVELPVLSEESFDVPTNAGGGIPGSGNPFNTDQGDESRASFYVHGKLVTGWGFRRQPEAIPSVVSSAMGNADWKKAQSLMIDPTYTTDDTYGIYTQSPDHVQLSANTSNVGP